MNEEKEDEAGEEFEEVDEMEESDFKEEEEFDPEYDEDLEDDFKKEEKEFDPEYETSKEGGVRTEYVVKGEQMGYVVEYDDDSRAQADERSGEGFNSELEDKDKVEKEVDVTPSDKSSRKATSEKPSVDEESKKDKTKDKTLKAEKGKRGKRGKKGRRGKPGKSAKIPGIEPKFLKKIEGEMKKAKESKKGTFKKTEAELKEEILKDVYKKLSVDASQQEQSERTTKSPVSEAILREIYDNIQKKKK